MSEQPRPEQHRDYYPHDSSQVLEWHERRHEAVHEILTKAGIKGSLTLLVEERVQRLACLHFEAVEKVQRLTSELNALLARAEKAEAERDELKRKLSESETEVKALHGVVNYWERKCQLQESRLKQAWDELKRQKDLANPVDWQRVRIDAAIAAMQGIVSVRALSATIAAELAKDYANALVAELKEEVSE